MKLKYYTQGCGCHLKPKGPCWPLTFHSLGALNIIQGPIKKKKWPFLSQNYLPLGLGVMKLQFLVTLPCRCYIPNLNKIGPVVFNKKMLMHDNVYRRHLIAIGHLSDSNWSGDLKIYISSQYQTEVILFKIWRCFKIVFKHVSLL